jgi:hypothetical protein
MRKSLDEQIVRDFAAMFAGCPSEHVCAHFLGAHNRTVSTDRVSTKLSTLSWELSSYHVNLDSGYVFRGECGCFFSGWQEVGLARHVEIGDIV